MTKFFLGTKDSPAAYSFAAVLTTLLILTCLCYAPGLSGSFLFDDFVNLTSLGNAGPATSWPAILRYVTSGAADPTGRPLTLLSFLIDAQDWPAAPYSFKRTNLLIHLVNGVLLCWSMLSLARAAGITDRHGRRAALVATAIWLLHPLFVSTTLYVIQREAMLPATFTFCGLIFWCKGRERLVLAQIRSAWIYLAAGAFLCTALAFVCKGNGALLPLLIATAEWTILRNAPTRHLKIARTIFLAFPIALLIFVLVVQGFDAERLAAENRPWTVTQRLMTEGRVIVDYLRLLWIPRATSFGVFNDQFRASDDLLHPWTTIPCLLAVAALVLFAWRMRFRHPVISFAIAFYLAGQVMESTFIPLELAFEHRNYLPAAFMFWPLAIWLTNENGRPWKLVTGGVILASLAVLTTARCEVWGDVHEQALIWGRVNPQSARAQAFAASIELGYGHTGAAIARLREAANRIPDEVQITLNLADAECKTGAITPTTWRLVLHSLQYDPNNARSAFRWFTTAIQNASHRACIGLTLDDLSDALQAAQSNRKFADRPGSRQDLDHVRALIELSTGNPEQALHDFNQALADAPDRGTALAQAAALGSAGYPELGLQHLAFAEQHAHYAIPPFGMMRIHEWILARQRYWEGETSHLRKVLQSDVATKSHNPNHAAD